MGGFPRSRQAIKRWGDMLEGIFDANTKNPMTNLYIAFVRTCSNDAFMGDRSPHNDTEKPGLSWHFRGKSIIEAVFTDLRKHMSMGNRSTDRVIFGGCSSGARGALTSLDWVASSGLAGNASVVGLMDSPVWLPLQPLLKSVVPFTNQTQMFLNFTNASAVATHPADCQAVYAENDWKCLQGSFRLPFVKTGFFLTQSQYDLFGISMNVFGRFAPFIPLNRKQREFAEAYRREIVKYFPVPKPGSGQTIYSTACYTHCSLSSHTSYKIKADGVGLVHLLQRWINTKSPDERTGYLVDRCKGFNCGRREAHP